MKRFLIVFLTPLVTSVAILIRFDFVQSVLKSYFGTNSGDIIGSILLLLSLYIYYFNIYIPFVTYERIAKSRWTALQQTIEGFILGYSGIMELNVNIMIPERKYFKRIEPVINNKKKKKFSRRVEVFKIIWQDEKSSIDQRFKLTINQGLCGEVYKAGKRTEGAALISSELGKYKFNFTEDQESLTKDLVILASCPIKIFEQTQDGLSKKVIAVLNVESKTLGSEEWILDRGKRNTFFKSIDDLEKLIRNLI
ncbi:hypothetical protein [Mucilaginibacter polytrichastri]|uniref:Uncharacterized protein n=1 Tax=Mucilaginibacter polytrichastri TaxID=1302689 RepID=A0A1Q6A2E4_9SPHI|nr:hypothetical protein [Mucilaginibacter polytrichastri]OKS88187.1 hypothetical protein RG47T_3651 [Mucilaginibacter polytrichastri]SFT08711.1 hypothetical protein SAMN04487890_11052 [Mucilaginibacter polytrichastri]